MVGEGCVICGKELEYLDVPKMMECDVCHLSLMSNVCCKNGHYVCDRCHSESSEAVVWEVCSSSKSGNPIYILFKMMDDPRVHMHGPEHHFLVGAALVTAYHNMGGQVNLGDGLREVLRRDKIVPGGFCGSAGCCGAAISAGTFYSIITDTTPMSVESWGKANLLTSKCLEAIALLGGPRCCKRDSITSVLVAAKFVEEDMGICMSMPESPKCLYSRRNSQCMGSRCPYHS